MDELNKQENKPLSEIEPTPLLDEPPKTIIPDIFYSPVFSQIFRFAEQFQEELKKLDLSRFIPALSSVSVLAQTLLSVHESNQVRAEKYPNLASNLTEFAARSWFLSLIMDFRSYEELGFAVDGVDDPEQRIAVIESSFSEFYRENMQWLGEVVVEKTPERVFAITPALNAHARGEYALSVPVFLSQAEGVLRDITSAELFTKQENISLYASAKRSEVNFDESWTGFSDDAYWAQLSGDLPIGWGPKQRKENRYDGLNRNTTLHGIDKSYATEVNSLKAFSLLCHVVGLTEVLPEHDESVSVDID